MNKNQIAVLRWACRVRDFLVEHDIKRVLAKLTGLRQELDETLGQRSADAAAQKTSTTQSRVQTTAVKRLRLALGEGGLGPTVRERRTTKLEMDGGDVTIVVPRFGMNSERFATAGNANATTRNVVGLQFVVRGLVSNSVEQLRNVPKVLRDAHGHSREGRRTQVTRRRRGQ